MAENEKLEPKRRFKEFQKAFPWEQRKLGDFGKATGGTSIESEFIEGGKYKVISIGSYSETSKYTDQGIRANKTQKTECRILNKGDLTMILNDKTSSGNIIGRVLLINADDFYVYNQRTERIEVYKNDYQPEFLYQLLNADNIRRKIICASQGNTQIYVNWTAISELKYMIPPLKEEQRKIGAFFEKLDSLIILHQRRLKKIEALKAAFLSEMFPAKGECEPKRRFAGYTGAWEQRKLLESVEKVIDFRGRTPKKLGMDWSDTGYLALSALNVKNGFIDPSVDAHYGNQVLYEAWMSGNELHKGQVLFTTEAPMGNVAQVPDNKGYILSQRTIAFEVKKELITENYLAVVLGSPKSFADLTALCSGGTAKGVSQKSLSGFYISVPKELKEQEEIAKLFQNLDNLITLHQRRLEKLQAIKKAYLNEMFI